MRRHTAATWPLSHAVKHTGNAPSPSHVKPCSRPPPRNNTRSARPDALPYVSRSDPSPDAESTCTGERFVSF
jgi:hypothetical protein